MNNKWTNQNLTRFQSFGLLLSKWPARNQCNTQSIVSGFLQHSCISSFQCITIQSLDSSHSSWNSSAME